MTRMEPPALEQQQPGIAKLPFDPALLLVVSDLHLGAGLEPATLSRDAGTNNPADQPFHGLLREQAARGMEHPVLVLAGDTFDFVRVTAVPETEADFAAWSQALEDLNKPQDPALLRRIDSKERRYGLRTNDYKSIWKLLLIARGHPGFFTALGEWLVAGGSLVIMRGNHDVELHWPLIRRAIRRQIAEAVPGAPVDTRLHYVEAGLRVGNVYLEHGHQFEDITAVRGDPVLSDGDELKLPLGSFVNRYILNSLERFEPLLDTTKPMSQVLLSVVRRQPVETGRIVWHALPLLSRALKPYWFKEWMSFAAFFGSLILPLVTLAVVAAAVMSPAFGRLLTATLGRGEVPLVVVGLMAPWILNAARGLLPQRQPRVGADHYAADIHRTLAEVRFPQAHELIYGVIGHTHKSDAQELPPINGMRVMYLNTGTWIPRRRARQNGTEPELPYCFVRFIMVAPGEYRHEQLEWLPETASEQPLQRRQGRALTKGNSRFRRARVQECRSS